MVKRYLVTLLLATVLLTMPNCNGGCDGCNGCNGLSGCGVESCEDCIARCMAEVPNATESFCRFNACADACQE